MAKDGQVTLSELRDAITKTSAFKEMREVFGMGVHGTAAAVSMASIAEPGGFWHDEETHRQTLMQQAAAMTPTSTSWRNYQDDHEAVPSTYSEIEALKKELAERDEIIEALSKDMEDIDALKALNDDLSKALETVSKELDMIRAIYPAPTVAPIEKYSGSGSGYATYYATSPTVTITSPLSDYSGLLGGGISSGAGSYSGGFAVPGPHYYGDWVHWSPPYGTATYPSELSGRMVEIKIRNGSQQTGTPEQFYWDNRGSPADIVQYRVVG